MSKTDKTRPWWVRATERPMVTCTPVHDHDHGPCTLPAHPRAGDPRTQFGFAAQAGCYWDASVDFWHTGGGYCGCAYCTDQAGRREERRRDRRAARAQARQVRQTWRGIDDEDGTF